MASVRSILDFGASNGGLTPPVFAWYRDAATGADIAAPAITATTGAAWTYEFDQTWPVPGSEDTTAIHYGVTLAGVPLTGVLLQPAYQQTRFFLDFGPGNGSLTPPAFTWYRDQTTKAALTPPTVHASAAPAWTYYFEPVFPSGTTAIEYGLSLGGVAVSGVLAAPAATQHIGGQQTLGELITLIRQESDTENDPHISDTELTTYINQSRLRLYDKLIQSFGDDYFSASAQFTTDGVNSEFQLPDGTAYGGAAPFYKGELLEVVAGGNVNPAAPVTLHPFNLREKNRYVRPFSSLAVPGFQPRYRILGSNPGYILFTPVPVSGMVCQLWYAPKLSPLVNDYDVADDFSGWLQLVVLDCAIKVLGKQERDASLLVTRKAEMLADLDRAIANRNIGDPNTVVETNTDTMGPTGLPGMAAFGAGYF